MVGGKRSLRASFGGLREATCKGIWPLEASTKRLGVCVCVHGKLSIKAWRW